jgi:hypothetical protein
MLSLPSVAQVLHIGGKTMVTIVRPLRTPQGNLVSPIGEGGASPMAPDALRILNAVEA